MKTKHSDFSLQPGTEVEYYGRRGRVTHMLDFDSVLVTDAADGKPRRVYVSQLKPVASSYVAAISDPQLVPDEDWRLAEKRFEIVRPLLDPRGRTREDVEKRAAEYGVHANTLYKWVALYETQGRITALLPKERSDKGSHKLSAEVEEIVRSVIDDEYLTRQAKTVKSVYRIVESRCAAAKLEPPHCNTLRNRIAALSAELKLARRRGRLEAECKFAPLRGSFPGADGPLSVVQIDHTKLDIVLVDDVRRRPIGRPWITLAIDVFSRMVAGFYVSFDPPGALSTGLCLAHAILPKDKWLARREIAVEWPLWGVPVKVHADNAKEFRGNMLQRACKQYGIDLEWRPVARPHFGGHIERLLGTLLKEIHTLPGTTFSNTRERGSYDSEGLATMTLGEFERWLATYVVEVYHKRVHSSLGMSPLDKFKEGVFGTDKIPGTGLPVKISDEDRLRLDFMPFVERTVQDYGVVVDDVHYYHDVLRRWINATEPGRAKVRRKFMFRRDPRDISVIWFFDPEIRTYYTIPYRDTAHPAMSVWELREARKAVSNAGGDEGDESAVFRAYDRMREIEATAKGKTKAVRRAWQRRKTSADTRVVLALPPARPTSDVTEKTSKVKPFEEMDEMNHE